MRIPPLLNSRLAKRQCVAFVGAGFSMPCGMPGWSQLLKALISRADAAVTDDAKRALIITAKNALDTKNLLLCASLIRQSLTSSELDLALRQKFDLGVYKNCSPQLKKRMTTRLRNLVSAPWAGIITTNYDELIEYALAKWSDAENHQSLGSDERLGVILAAGEGGQFFVKLHGTVGASHIVLSTEEYDRIYLGAPQVLAFLTAVMLSYHVVFIGCSLEDEIVRLRKKLSVDFNGIIPMAYALMPSSRPNRLRSSWLRDNAQIECLLYPEEDNAHKSVDRFLQAASNLMLSSKSLRLGVTKTTAEILRQPISRRLKEVGNLNFSLLKWIFDNPGHSLEKSAILDCGRAPVCAPSQLQQKSTEERMYRVFFLVSIKLLEEKSHGAKTKYGVPEVVCQAMSS